METQVTQKNILKGGEFLVKDAATSDVFIPEEKNEEQKMIYEMAKSFVETEIMPNIEKIEAQDPAMPDYLFNKCGELGLLGAHMPLEYGGMDLDFNTNTLLCDALGSMGSFNTSFAAHTGIGMLPILYFGTKAQKEKYLPKMITGEWKSAYCLTEPGSGSDALAAKTRADLNAEESHYILNGQKMWISNAGFADVFIVFAKIEGSKLTGFIVEKGTPGLTLGEEEKKLGIKGSSTRQVFFENVKVPVDALLGEIGKGHHIALNTLNMGRYKLGAFCIGGSKRSTDLSVKYANERHQFGVPIASFGAIKYKLAEQAIRTFTLESAIFRISNSIQEKIKELKSNGQDFASSKLIAAEEYAIECSITKIVGSEVIDYIVDEMVQIHGGIGYSEEYEAARAYRDARINRIYEGTNEINRLVIINMLLKRALKGKINLTDAAWAVQKDLAKMPSFRAPEGDFAYEYQAVKNMKKCILMVVGAAAKMQMDGKLEIRNEQEIIINASDMIIDLYMAESLLLRIHKLKEINKYQEVHEAILKVYFWDASQRLAKNAKDAIVSFVTGDLLKTFMMGIKRFDQYPPQNIKKFRRQVADYLIAKNGYTLS